MKTTPETGLHTSHRLTTIADNRFDEADVSLTRHRSVYPEGTRATDYELRITDAGEVTSVFLTTDQMDRLAWGMQDMTYNTWSKV